MQSLQEAAQAVLGIWTEIRETLGIPVLFGSAMFEMRESLTGEKQKKGQECLLSNQREQNNTMNIQNIETRNLESDRPSRFVS
jgi:hypothetical protein